MSGISQGSHANLILDAGDVFRIATVGVATVVAAYGAPAGTTTLTAQTADFGPYSAAAKVIVTAVNGVASYSFVRQDGTLTAAEAAATVALLDSGAGQWPMRNARTLLAARGTASGATTDAAGYAIGATTINLAAVGTGTVLNGDPIYFAGDTTRYTVNQGDGNVANGGSITINSPGLVNAIPAALTAITIEQRVGASSAGGAATTIGAVDALPWNPGFQYFGGPLTTAAGAYVRIGYWTAHTAVVAHGGFEVILTTKDATGRFEMMMFGSTAVAGNGCRMLIRQPDGTFHAATAAATFFPNVADSAVHRQVCTLGAAGTYWLRFEFAPANGFAGFGLIPGDTISAPPAPAGRMLLVTDSYGGTVSDSGSFVTGADSYAAKLRHRMSRDIFVASAGGCGWVYKTGGAAKKVNDYLADCIAQAGPFDVVVFAHGYNDITNAQSVSDVTAEATTAMNTVKSLLPTAAIRCISPWKVKGAGTTVARHLAIRDAIKTVCEAAGGLFVDLTSKRDRITDRTVQDSWSAQLSSDVAANATSLVVANAPLPFSAGSVAAARNGWWVHIKDAADPTKSEMRLVTAMGSTDPRTLTVAALTNAHAAATTTIYYAGPGTITGTGKQDVTAGDGNADWAIGPDGVHLTVAGHDLYADDAAAEMLASVRAAAGLT